MTSRSKVFSTATARTGSAFADYIRDFGSILFDAAERFYEARMEKAQMRLAHTRYLDGMPPSRGSNRFG
jgi:hypothetical protein